MTGFRERLWQILRPASLGDRSSLAADILIVGLVFIDAVCFILDSVPSVSEAHARRFAAVEHIVLFVYTVDHVLRMWACTVDDRYDSRLRYAVTPFAIIDLIAILPILVYIPGIGSALFVDPELTLVRVFRIFRIGKLARYSRSVRSLGRALKRVGREFSVLLFSVLILVLLSSTLAYVAESKVNEEFGSIPEAMWWAIVTMTTVGYGDMVPITPMGRAIATVLMICGIGMFAVPAGLLGATFSDEVREEHRRDKLRREERLRRVSELRWEKLPGHPHSGHVVCPHCSRSFLPEKPEKPEKEGENPG